MFKSFRYPVCFWLALTSLALAQEKKPDLPASTDSDCKCKLTASNHYSRTVAAYTVPDVQLVDMHRQKHSLREGLNHDGPVMLQFAFTSCSTICPVLSGTFAGVQSRLDSRELHNTRLFTITIDPDYDSPDRLRSYAESLQASKQWQFLTGTPHAIATVQKAFDAHAANKMRHEPLIFLRGNTKSDWVRLNGLMSVQQLLDEYRKIAHGVAATQTSSPPGIKDPTAEVSQTVGSDAMRQTCCGLLAAFGLAVLCAPHLTFAGDLELGKTIYETGVLPTGDALTGAVYSDVVLSGSNVACAKCHRTSGYGSDEAGKFVPPITGRLLFHAFNDDRADSFRALFQEPQSSTDYAAARIPRTRPAYDRESLARVLRDGIASDGRQLKPLMPKYELSDSDLNYLTTYLRILGATDAPGVDQQLVHFATVIAGDVDVDQKSAMLDVIRAFVDSHNLETSRYLERPGVSVNYKNDFRRAWRSWKVHTWELNGPRSTYRQQLAEHYQRQPVFAMLSGLAAGPWQPMHQFCEEQGIPCLFPNSDWSSSDPHPHYTIYLSPGLISEAQAAARYVASMLAAENKTGKVVQLFTDRPRARLLADSFRQELRDNQRISLEDIQDVSGSTLVTVLKQPPDFLVIWAEENDLVHLPIGIFWRLGPGRLIISGGLLDSQKRCIPGGLPDSTLATWPWEVDERRSARIHRVRAWLRSRGVAGEFEQTRLNTHFSLSLASHGMRHILDHFSRDYFIERIEHETENSLSPGVYPSMSLGPGQRFAAKGCYLVQQRQGIMTPITEWILY